MKKITIIPEPKKISFQGKNENYPLGIEILASEGCVFEAAFLKDCLTKACAKRFYVSVKKDTPGYFLCIPSTTNMSFLSPKKDGKWSKHGCEAYCISSVSDGVEICGNSQAGVFYGVQTLLQIIDLYSEELPAFEISDWPSLSLRGIHLDLKGIMPDFNYLLELPEKFSKFKINTILLEYEDKFSYALNSEICAPYALTKEQTKRLEDVARQHHIQIIPLVQCLGHVEYVLRHKKYSSVAEGDEVQQYCPLKPESLELFKSFVREVIEVNSSSKYFHIGGDEARHLGKCPKCKQAADISGKSKLFAEYIKKACEFVLSLGKTPIIWDDMITSGSPETVNELPPETVLMYWQYSHCSEIVPTFNWHGDKCSSKWYKKQHGNQDASMAFQLSHYHTGVLEDIPAEVMDQYMPYVDNKDYPMFFNSLPFLKYLKDCGRKVIGASCIRTSKEPDYLFPDFVTSVDNVKLWAKKAEQEGAEGVVSTAWARSSTFNKPCAPFELCWYSTLASGEYYWNGETQVSIEEFDRKFCQIFFGLENLEVLDAMHIMNSQSHQSYHKEALRLLENIESSVVKNTRAFAFLKGAAKLLWHRSWRDAVLHGLIENRIYRIKKKTLSEYETRQFIQYLKELRELRKSLYKELKTLYISIMPEDEADEYLQSELGWEDSRIEEYLNLIKKS